MIILKFTVGLIIAIIISYLINSIFFKKIDDNKKLKIVIHITTYIINIVLVVLFVTCISLPNYFNAFFDKQINNIGASCKSKG